MLSPGDTVITGVSGGADSVCLLLVLTRLREEFASETGRSPEDALGIKVIHVNHMIRGEEADRDEAFVRKLCDKLDVSFKVCRKNIPAMVKEQHLTEEEAGRLFRYECFEKEAVRYDAKIAVAHNRDDLAETVLYNMVRGSSLLGLAGIKPLRDRIIRPLLMTSREDIEKYLELSGQSYVTDSTNLEADYARNKLRLKVMPLLREINSGAVDHMVEIALESNTLAEEMKEEVRGLVEAPDKDKELAEKGQDKNSDHIDINIETLNSLGSLAKGELVLSVMEKICGRRKDITGEHIRSVIALSEKESGKRVDLPYGMTAERIYDRISIRSESVKTEGDGGVKGSIVVGTFAYTEDLDISKKEYTKMIDCDKIKSTLVLRNPEPDDFIVVTEEGGTKKLARFFTDRKVERNLRQSIPVVADGNEIVWIIGMRLSERYKISPSTKTVVEITYKEA